MSGLKGAWWSVATTAIAAALLSLRIEGAERPFEDLTDRERIERRFGPGAGEQRRAMAIAEKRVDQNTQSDVVDGARDPELLMAWELMSHLSGAFGSDEAKLAGFVERWRERGAAKHLGDDFVSQLRAVAGAYFDADAESSRLQVEGAKGGPAVEEALRARRSELNKSLCRLRANAVAEGRRRFGHANFQRFLYQVVAPDVVIMNTPASSPEAAFGLWQWVEEGCR